MLTAYSSTLQLFRIYGVSRGPLITNYHGDPSRTNRFSTLAGGVTGLYLAQFFAGAACEIFLRDVLPGTVAPLILRAKLANARGSLLTLVQDLAVIDLQGPMPQALSQDSLVGVVLRPSVQPHGGSLGPSAGEAHDPGDVAP